MNNLTHWYDGWFYDIFIAPNQDKSFAIIKNLIHDNSTVLDIGFGTGRLEFQIASKCSKVVGIDLSFKNVERAKKKLSETDINNVEFFHSDIHQFVIKNKEKFDFAVLSFVIHEVDENLRCKILNEASNIADQIIIIDYEAPQSNGIWKYLNEIVEFAAGENHYKNYKNYLRNNGIKGIAEKCELKIIKEINKKPVSSQITVLTKLT